MASVFLNASTFGDDIFHHENFFAVLDFESATQNKFPFLLFDKNESNAELPRDFLADDQSAHCRRNNRNRAKRSDFRRERRAELFDDRHLLKRKRALKKLAAVQAAAQNEMAFQQRAGIAENLQCLIFCHAAKIKS